MNNYQRKIFKVCIVGNGGVGKTTILHRYVDGKFVNDTKVTVGTNFFMKTLIFPEQDLQVALQIWDLSGQPQFDMVRPNFYSGASGIIYTFELTSLESLIDLDNWKLEVEKVVGVRPGILIGNKLDLVDNAYEIIEKEKILQIKQNLNLAAYFETSAKEDIMVREAFYIFTKEILNYYLKKR
jgi:Ras-related protein Rab-7A